MTNDPNYYGPFQRNETQIRDSHYPDCEDDCDDEREPIMHSDCCDELMEGENLKLSVCPKCQCDCSRVDQYEPLEPDYGRILDERG